MNLLTRICKSDPCRIPVSLLIILLLIVPPGLIPAQSPHWWQARGITNGSPADDYAALNQGQLKNLVAAAVKELEVGLPNGAGDILHSLVRGWALPTSQTDDYAAVNVGQLKAVARLVFDRLKEVGFTSAYPWDNSLKQQDDYALANIGQAKNLFAFDVTKDTNGVGIPDWWQNRYGLDIAALGGAQTLAANGLPYLVDFQYGLDPNDANSANAPHTINGQTDGLTWLEAYQQGTLASLKPPSTAVEVALSSSMQDVGNWSGGGGGTGTFTTSADAFSGIGSAEYLQTDPATGQVLLSVKDVLTVDQVLEYQQWEDFPSESPGMFDGAEWRTDWSDTVTELRDTKNHPVVDEKTGDKRMHGSWSGIYHRTTEIMESPEFSKTGVEVWNDSLASRPSKAPDVKEAGGRVWGGETYHFTDAEQSDGNGIQIYSAEFDSMRPLWQTIEVPEAMKVHYPPTPGPFIAAATLDGKYGKYENRLAFWLKTSDRSEATETIKRNYWKVTTRDSDRSHPVIESVPVTISKGAKTSAIVSLQAEAGTNVSLQTVEFQANDITKGFDYPMQGDPPAEYTYGMKEPIVKDQDQPECWTSVARTAASPRGLNENHHVRVVFDSLDLAKLCELHYSTNPALLKVEGDGFAVGGTLTKKDTLLKITGLDSSAASGIQTVDVQVRIKSTHQVLQTLKVLVMPERKVRLRVHFVEDHTTNIGGIGPPRYLSSVPDTYKDVPGIVQRLNEVYRQNCLTFVNAGSGTLDVRGWDYTPNGILDCENTPKTGPVVWPSELPRVEPNITLQSGALHILVFRKINNDGAAGFWDRLFMKNCIFIGAENHEQTGVTLAQSKPYFLRNCAHEVGHALQLSVRHRIVDGNEDRHDGGVDPVRYSGMLPLMTDKRAYLPEHTWLRHEEWEPASKFVKENYLLP